MMDKLTDEIREVRPTDVFISFATNDSSCASNLKRGLEAAGIRCWKAPEDIFPGESWPNAIARALSGCRVMVLICSSHSVISRDVSKELTLAMNRGCIVVPFRIEDIALSGDWAYHLSNVQWFNAFEIPLDSSIEHLGTYLLSLLNDPMRSERRETLPESVAEFRASANSKGSSDRQLIEAFLGGLREELGRTEDCFTMLKLSRQQLGSDVRHPSPLLSLENLVRAKQSNDLKEFGFSSLERAFGRWIITGAPGCGKSTLMRKLAISQAVQALTKMGNSTKIPLLLDLGRYEPGSLIDLSLPVESVSRYSRRLITEAELRQLLTDNDIIWIMDGLDEGMIGISQVNDSPLWKEIESLLHQYPAHSFVISTRTSHIPVSTTFETVFIKDMDASAACEFISRYLSYFERPESGRDVYAAIPEKLRQISNTPLILSLVISAYLTNGSVPEDTSALYREYVAHTLSYVEAARHGHIKPEIKDMALSALAFEMLTSARPVIRQTDAQAVLVRRMHQLSVGGEPAPEAQVGMLIDELVYSGLLTRQEYRLSFAHLTLLEFFAACEMSREYNFAAQAAMDQYFLRSMDKIKLILKAAAITEDTRLIEVGAGIGSVAKHFPPAKSLTLIDLDPDLVKILRYQLSDATVLEMDAVVAIRELPFDILISNLPFFLTESILDGLCGLRFRRAVMSVHIDQLFAAFEGRLLISTIGILDEEDFFPRQPFKSKLILVEPKVSHPIS